MTFLKLRNLNKQGFQCYKMIFKSDGIMKLVSKWRTFISLENCEKCYMANFIKKWTR